MHVRVKVCGITSEGDLAAAVDAGVDALGFVLSPSPRRLSPERYAELARRLPPYVASVAVFRHPPRDLLHASLDAWQPDWIQMEAEQVAAIPEGVFHRWLPVLHDADALIEDCEALLGRFPSLRALHLEGPGRGGRGVGVDRSRARAVARRIPLVLAGGLRPDNVARAIEDVRPIAVDVSSGVEKEPGVKCARSMRDFVQNVREAGERIGETEPMLKDAREDG